MKTKSNRPRNIVCFRGKHRMFLAETSHVFRENTGCFRQKYRASFLQTFSVSGCLSLFALRIFVLIKIKFQADFLKIMLKTWRNVRQNRTKLVHARNLKIFCFSKQFLVMIRGFQGLPFKNLFSLIGVFSVDIMFFVDKM